MLLLGLFLIRKKKQTLGRIILTIWLLLLTAPAAFLGIGFAALLIQAVLGVSPNRYTAILACIAVMAVSALLCLMWGVLKKKKVWITICVLSGIQIGRAHV